MVFKFRRGKYTDKVCTFFYSYVLLEEYVLNFSKNTIGNNQVYFD